MRRRRKNKKKKGEKSCSDAADDTADVVIEIATVRDILDVVPLLEAFFLLICCVFITTTPRLVGLGDKQHTAPTQSVVALRSRSAIDNQQQATHNKKKKKKNTNLTSFFLPFSFWLPGKLEKYCDKTGAASRFLLIWDL